MGFGAQFYVNYSINCALFPNDDEILSLNPKFYLDDLPMVIIFYYREFFMSKNKEFYKIVENWAYNKGFKVEMKQNGHNTICFEAFYITINASQGAENRLFSLLHECGHILLCQDEKRYKEAFPGVWNGIQDKRRSRGRFFRVSLVEEEMMAWNEGLKLAKRLGVNINEDKWNKHKTDCLYTYLRWAVITVGMVHE